MKTSPLNFKEMSTKQKVAVGLGVAAGAAAVGATIAAAVKGKNIVNDEFIKTYAADKKLEKVSGAKKALLTLKEGFKSIGESIKKLFSKKSADPAKPAAAPVEKAATETAPVEKAATEAAAEATPVEVQPVSVEAAPEDGIIDL